MYLREIKNGCHALSPYALPPRSLNLENQINTKLEFAEFKSENNSRYLYTELFDDVTQTLKISLKTFLTIARKSELGVFEIDLPYFGLIRGDIISILHCKQQKYEVISKTKFCTKVSHIKVIFLLKNFILFIQKELQVRIGTETLYIVPGTKLAQKYFRKAECLPGDLGDVSEVKDKFGKPVFIIQQDSIYIYNYVTGSIEQYSDILINPMEFEGQLSYISYHGTGLYDYDSLRNRHQYVFRYR